MLRYPDAVILVFCKTPIPGQVKTRLMSSLTGEEAAALHCELTELTLDTATQQPLCELQLWCSPTIEHPFFSGLAQKYPLSLQLQQGADLGERMHHAFCAALAQYKSAVIIGCDCPSLTPTDLEQALAELADGNDCVLASAEDGGYVLIGLNAPQPSLFEAMPWGKPEIMALTLGKAKVLGLSFKLLKKQWDLDTNEDLVRYRAHSWRGQSQ